MLGDDFNDYSTSDLLILLNKLIGFADIPEPLEEAIRDVIHILHTRELSAVGNRVSEIFEADNFQ